jgi:2-polyprenyl-3-methyl-5-hydroxy-6-metoxy-1,4-benzoquinol methylase
MKRRRAVGPHETAACDEDYFESYGDLSVHSLMLRDEPRMAYYIAALESLKPQIAGKRVLEVGCGTGVLSLLCWKICGPKEIVAVEATKSTADLAEEIFNRNNANITVVHSRVEDLTGILSPESFDVLLSEWMGFYLLHEGMLDSVIYARDHFCTSEVIMIPDRATLRCAAWYAEQFLTERVWSWSRYLRDFQLDFSPFGQLELANNIGVPVVDIFSESEIISDEQVLLDLDLRTVSIDFFRKSGDIVNKQIAFTVNKQNQYFTGLMFFWMVGNGQVQLETAPYAPPTHWKQVGILLGCCAPVVPGQLLDLQVSIVRDDPDAREFSIDIQA